MLNGVKELLFNGLKGKFNEVFSKAELFQGNNNLSMKCMFIPDNLILIHPLLFICKDKSSDLAIEVHLNLSMYVAISQHARFFKNSNKTTSKLNAITNDQSIAETSR